MIKALTLFIFSISLSLSLSATEATKSLLKYKQGRRFLWGTAVQYKALKTDSQYRNHIIKHYNLITPEYYMKWSAIEKHQGKRTFEPLDYILKFAKKNNIFMRGHTLLWYRSIPKWLKQTNKEVVYKITRQYIKDIISHSNKVYPGGILFWDVINEAIDDNGKPRKTVFSNIVDPPYDYIEKAFTWAHKYSPNSKLFYNDYGIEFSRAKFQAIYKLLKRLVDKNIPIHGIGLQFHLSGKRTYNFKKLREQFQKLENLGLEIHITEMDINMTGVLKNKKEKIYLFYKHILSTCLQVRACTVFSTWGTTEKYSWLKSPALPFDNDFKENRVNKIITQTVRKKGPTIKN